MNQHQIVERVIATAKQALDLELEVPKRLSMLGDIIHALEYEQRWQSLTRNQVVHMEARLSPGECARLEAASTDFDRDELFTGMARVRYFRECAWVTYLNGEGEPPIEPEGEPGSWQHNEGPEGASVD